MTEKLCGKDGLLILGYFAFSRTQTHPGEMRYIFRLGKNIIIEAFAQSRSQDVLAARTRPQISPEYAAAPGRLCARRLRDKELNITVTERLSPEHPQLPLTGC